MHAQRILRRLNSGRRIQSGSNPGCRIRKQRRGRHTLNGRFRRIRDIRAVFRRSRFRRDFFRPGRLLPGHSDRLRRASEAFFILWLRVLESGLYRQGFVHPHAAGGHKTKGRHDDHPETGSVPGCFPHRMPRNSFRRHLCAASSGGKSIGRLIFKFF